MNRERASRHGLLPLSSRKWAIAFSALVLALLLATGRFAPLNQPDVPQDGPSPNAPASNPSNAEVEAQRSTAALKLRTIPLAFEPNVGQTSPGVQYVARPSDGVFLFAQTGITMSLDAALTQTSAQSSTAAARRTEDNPQSGYPLGDRVPSGRPKSEDPWEPQVPASGATSRPDVPEPPQQPAIVGIGLVGANREARVESGAPLKGKVNYLRGHDPSKWQQGISTYSAITYTGIYPGVDLSYSGDRYSLNSAFTLSPGAGLSQLRLQLEGADARLDARGNLLMLAPLPSGGTVTTTLQSPVAWQEGLGQRVPVSVRYELSQDGIISLAVGDHDKAKPLSIETTLSHTQQAPPSPNTLGQSAASPSQTTRQSQSAIRNPQSAIQNPQAPNVLPSPIVRGPFPQFVSPPLSGIAPASPRQAPLTPRWEHEREKTWPGAQGAVLDPVIQLFAGPFAVPTPMFTFEGISNRNRVNPPT